EAYWMSRSLVPTGAFTFGLARGELLGEFLLIDEEPDDECAEPDPVLDHHDEVLADLLEADHVELRAPVAAPPEHAVRVVQPPRRQDRQDVPRDDRQAERPEHRAGPLALRAERHGEEPHRGEDVDELERKPKRRYRVEDQTETWSGQRPASS